MIRAKAEPNRDVGVSWPQGDPEWNWKHWFAKAGKANLRLSPGANSEQDYTKLRNSGSKLGIQALAPSVRGGAHSKPYYMNTMAQEHPHAAATYRIIPQNDMTFGVEVVVPGAYPAMVTSFASAHKAEAWITDYKRRVAENCQHKFARTRIHRK